MRLQFAPLYVLTIKPIQTHFLVDAEKYSITYNKDNLPTKTSDKLKYFRYQKGLIQKEVADFADMDRGSYSNFESAHRDYYNKDKILKIAEILEVDVTDLVDEYNLFLYDKPDLALKNLRKSQGLTQSEFAKKYNLTLHTVKGIEQGIQLMYKSTWEKLFKKLTK